jgi:hypothetical protein
MALSKIDVANMLTGATPVANGGTALTSGFTNGSDPRPLSKPIIINGDMQVSQRTTSETGITDNRYSSCDRFKIEIDNCGTWTVIQETLTSGAAYNAGFRKALRLDCTTADASPASADAVIVSHRMEGQNLNVFKKGTSSAEKYTLAFWIKSNKTGTAQVNFTDEENTRMCSGQYTISSADTWEKKIINIAADTSGASANDNTESIRISWFFDAGSNYTSGAVPTAWESTSAGDKSVSDLALADNTNNDVAITGVQLEVGEFSSTTLPPFQFETHGENLQRCLRYCYQISGDGSNATDLTQITGTGGAGFGVFRFPVQMRASPTQSDSGDNTFTMYGPNTGDPSSLRGDRTNPNSCGIVTDTSITSGNSVNIRVDTGTSNFIRFDAEL